MPREGKFISLEGTEGVGKSTNLKVMADWLDDKGIDYIQTREPGGTPLAEELRELLLQPREEEVDATAELLLIFAARAQHLAKLIEPALARGTWVLSDRFTDATYAYQGGGRQLSMAQIAQLENFVQQGRQPDCTILLDADPAVGMARAEKRGELDRFESEQVAFFARVREVYLRRARAYPERFHVIDAARDEESIKRDIEAVLAALSEQR